MNIIQKVINRIQLHRNPINFWRSKGVQIGNDCEVYTSANFGSEPYLISIGNHVRINAGVQLITHDGGTWVLREKYKGFEDVDLIKPIRIGDNVHIGSNAIVFPGITIGNNCIIGVNAIVTHDIPDNSVAVGIPARVIENIDDYFNKHKEEFVHTKKMHSKQKREYLISMLIRDGRDRND